MSDPWRDEGDGAAAPRASGADGRLPYEKPAVAWEKALEAQPGLMTACGKSPAEGPSCGGTGPMLS